MPPRDALPDRPDSPPARPVGSPPSPGPGHRRIAAGDGSLFLRVRGRGSPLLCLHGLTAHGGVWGEVIRRLEDRFRLYVPDLLGRGRSDGRPGRAHDLDRELERLEAVRSELPAGPGLVLGHSQGAALAVALAARGASRGFRPAGLVLVTPVTPWTGRPRVLDLLRIRAVRRLAAPAAARLRIPVTRWVLERRAFGDPTRVDDALVRRYAAPFRDRHRAEALLRILADWRPAELSAHVPEAPPPTCVVAGGRDLRIPAAEARRWARALGGSFRLAPEAGHMVPVERPDLVAGATLTVARRADTTV